jgi:hypothetical protein
LILDKETKSLVGFYLVARSKLVSLCLSFHKVVLFAEWFADSSFQKQNKQINQPTNHPKEQTKI